MKLACLVPAVWLGALLIAMPAMGQETKEPPKERRAFDAATGRNLLNFPPHRSADIRHMRLQLRIPSMNDRTMLASETLTVAPIGRELADVRLHAAQLQVSAVSSAGRSCTFERDETGEGLTIRMDPPVSLGSTAEIVINYRVSDPPEGLIWTIESAAFPGRAAQIYSQGQTESNRYWFASHDFPNEQMTTEIIATVPRGFQVVSNGRLESVKRETVEPYDTFHWVQDKPHVSYLVTMVVGKFDVVDVGTSRLPMPVYVPPGQGERVKGTFGRTPQMVQLLERLTGQPYPWAKYAQVAVWNFDWGGMENTSATTLYESIALDRTALLDGDQDGLIVHELAHQWFGDLVTCKSWEHLWLNEGFATYSEALWEQYKNGGSRGAPSAAAVPTAGLKADNAAYDALIWEWSQGLIENDVADAPYEPAMASKEYTTPDEAFSRKANPYPKGAMLLHMLRLRVGDEAFFKGVAEYLQRHKFQSVETHQFRQALERASGTSLQRFFDQWVYRPGVPRINVTPSWSESDGVLSVAFEQTQSINGFNPAFDVRVPIWVRTRASKDGGFEKLEARFDTRTHTFTAKLAGTPGMIVVDPEQATLADYRVTLLPEQWATQLASGPTLLSRLRAAEGLGDAGPAHIASALGTLSLIVRDERSARELRLVAARTLGKFAKAADGLRDASAARIADARVRAVVVEQAAQAAIAGEEQDRDALATTLARVFRDDASYAVRAAAVRALGSLGGDAAKTTIAAALNTDSQHDQIRKAAVEALGKMDTPDALGMVLLRTAPGNSSSLRSTATSTLAKLAHHDPGRVFDALVSLLDDREPRTKGAAGKALSEIGGERVRRLFESRLAAPTSRAWDGRTKLWLRDMRKEDAGSADASKGE